jgi:hypothetical protein
VLIAAGILLAIAISRSARDKPYWLTTGNSTKLACPG